MYRPNYLNAMIQVDDFAFGTVLGDDSGIGPLPGFELDRGRHRVNVKKPRKVRVLVAKPSLNGHDREIRMAALTLMDAGFEVIYMGCRPTPEEILSAAVQEDVDLIGLNILPGEDKRSFPRVLELLKENNVEDISIVGLGIFPVEDIRKLKDMGIKEIFEPDARPWDIIDWVGNNVRPRGTAILER